MPVAALIGTPSIGLRPPHGKAGSPLRRTWRFRTDARPVHRSGMSYRPHRLPAEYPPAPRHPSPNASKSPAPRIVVDVWCDMAPKMDRARFDGVTRDRWCRFDHADLEALKRAILRREELARPVALVLRIRRASEHLDSADLPLRWRTRGGARGPSSLDSLLATRQHQLVRRARSLLHAKRALRQAGSPIIAACCDLCCHLTRISVRRPW
jgi:hypothetical protein